MTAVRGGSRASPDVDVLIARYGDGAGPLHMEGVDALYLHVAVAAHFEVVVPLHRA